MTEVYSWLSEPLSRDVSLALDRLAHAPGVRRIAVMPDVHLAEHVCVGTVVATDGVIYPQAVGGDIGCGMATLRLHANVDAVDESRATALLAAWRTRVPIVRQPKRRELASLELFDERLQRRVRRDAEVQFGTVGRGNHFVELQADERGELWLAVHSGSRALGPAIREHHFARHGIARRELRGLTGAAAVGYLHDHDVAVAYARDNRRAIAAAALAGIEEVLGATADRESWFDVTHNFVRTESHGAATLHVHRKGACSALDGERGIIPGSMGTATYHVEGRGCAASMNSSSHGAGRRLARGEAMRRITVRGLQNDLRGVFYEQRLVDRLRDEAPGAYKDITKVMRAQKELVRITRRLRPVVAFKGA